MNYSLISLAAMKLAFAQCHTWGFEKPGEQLAEGFELIKSGNHFSELKCVMTYWMCQTHIETYEDSFLY